MTRAFLIAISAMLAGCSAFQDTGHSASDGTVSGQAASLGEPTPGLGAVDANASPNRTLGGERLEAVPRPKKKPGSIAAIRPDALVGLTPDEVATLIGRPASTTDQPPATVWYYQTNHCALEVFFYMDVGSKAFRALTFNLKSPDGKPASPSHCLRQIRAISYGG